MPISYTKRGWTNNSPPAINAANLGAMDDGLKNAIDALNTMGDAGQQAVKEIGAAPATTTGGKLVNKITEAGYSLAPATGTSNLDNIADGTSYKRIQAAKADALNSSTIVAGTIWSSGNDGNGGTAPAPKGITGSTYVPMNTPTTVATLAAGGSQITSPPVVYMFSQGSAIRNIANCATFGIIVVLYTAATYIPIKTASNATVSLSGRDIQITATDVSDTRGWTLTRIY